MPIRKRGKKYQAEISANGRRYRKTFARKLDAEKWLVQARVEAEEGNDPSPYMSPPKPPKPHYTGIKLGDLREMVFKHQWSRQRGNATAEINSRKVCDFIGWSTPIDAITVTTVKDMVLEWSKELADGTINRRLSALNTMLTYAVEAELLDQKPRVKLLKERSGRVRFFSHDEERAIIEYLEYAGYSTVAEMVKVAIDTGMRQSEIINLKVQDIQMHNNGKATVSVWENKSDHPRTIPLTNRSREILLERCKKLGHRQDKQVFTGMKKHHVRKGWDRMRLGIGMHHDSQFVFHCTRHTFCSRLAQQGVSLLAIQQMAGHKSVTMTQRYAHMSTAALETGIDVLNRLNSQTNTEASNDHDPNGLKATGI